MDDQNQFVFLSVFSGEMHVKLRNAGDGKASKSRGNSANMCYVRHNLI
jgi:hypothetical protein